MSTAVLFVVGHGFNLRGLRCERKSSVGVLLRSSAPGLSPWSSKGLTAYPHGRSVALSVEQGLPARCSGSARTSAAGCGSVQKASREPVSDGVANRPARPTFGRGDRVASSSDRRTRRTWRPACSGPSAYTSRRGSSLDLPLVGCDDHRHPAALRAPVSSEPGDSCLTMLLSVVAFEQRV